MDIIRAKSISLSSLLHALGHDPALRDRGDELWYYSPLRTKERTASFKVKGDRLWYDFGTGSGGTIIDFSLHYLRTDSIKRVLDWLSQFEHLSDQTIQIEKHAKRVRKTDTAITIREVKPLAHHVLLHYLREHRKIDLLIARNYVKEVHYTVDDIAYVGIGFPNRSGGYELRSPRFKGSSSPKDLSVIKSIRNRNKAVAVFEGFIDFLSLLTRNKQTTLSEDIIILNSAALGGRAVEYITEKAYRQVSTWFDNDRAGLEMTARFEQSGFNVLRQNHHYHGFHDVNEWHVKSHATGLLR